jgi:nucleotidyltransferase/DNA polymerase involved in DNA repair
MRRARDLCPSVIAIPYEFEKYRSVRAYVTALHSFFFSALVAFDQTFHFISQVSRNFYMILGRYTSHIQAVSCDEVSCPCSPINSNGVRVF